MNVAEEHQPAPFGRPLVALVSTDAGVRGAVVTPVHDGREALAREVADVAVGIRPSAALAIVLAARRHVEKMLNHTGAYERVAALIPIHTPRIAGAIGEHLEL